MSIENQAYLQGVIDCTEFMQNYIDKFKREATKKRIYKMLSIVRNDWRILKENSPETYIKFKGETFEPIGLVIIYK